MGLTKNLYGNLSIKVYFSKGLCKATWKWAHYFYKNSIRDNKSILDQMYKPPEGSFNTYKTDIGTICN